MDASKKPEQKSYSLRRRAKEIVDSRTSTTKQIIQPLHADEVETLVHELEVHQVELQIQNDNLTAIQEELFQSRNEFLDLFNQAPIGYCTITKKGEILDVNQTLCKLLQTNQTSLNQQSFFNLIYEKDHQTYYDHRKQVLQTKTNHTCEVRLLQNKEKPMWFRIESKLYPSTTKGDTIRSVLSDISAEKKVANLLEIVNEKASNQQKITKQYLDVMGTMLLVLNTKGEVTLINRRGCDILKLSEKDILGKNWFDHFIPKENVEEIKLLFESLQTDKTPDNTKYRNPILDGNGDIVIMSFSNSRVYDSNNNVTSIISSGEDITIEEMQHRKLQEISYHDSLTKLYNRRYYEEMLETLDTSSSYPLSIVMGDINGLKLVNDAFGHKAGDTLLIHAANTLQSVCKDNHFVARMGGDEFVLVMPNTDEKQAEKMVHEINQKSKQITVESIELSISFGIRTKHSVTEDIQEIYRGAEDAMYREKLLEIPSMRGSAIDTILQTLYEKDPNSEIHSRVVSQISSNIATVYGMSREDISTVKTAGILHDIGKIIIPSEILSKQGLLTTAEMITMKSHPEIGFRILNSTQNMRNLSDIVLSHHERWDGTGYPRGLKNTEIPLKSRIISIADSYDAMVSERTYKPQLSVAQALEELKACSGTQFDPDLVTLFLEHLEQIL